MIQDQRTTEVLDRRLRQGIATKQCYDVRWINWTTAMVQEYKSETNLRVRVVYLLMLPFVSMVAGILISFFDLFSDEAHKLIASIIGGDMTRFGDFLGYLTVVVVCLGCSGALIFGLIFNALFKTNQVTEIDSKARTVVVRNYSPWPWHRKRDATYLFDEVCGLKLRYDDEQSEILLYLRDRKSPLTLVAERQSHVAKQKFNRLTEIGLPSY